MADLDSAEPVDVSESNIFSEAIAGLNPSEIAAVIASIWQGIFFVIAQYMKQDHWALDGKEAAELGKATWGLVKALPAKQSKAWEKRIKEYSPFLKFAIVSGGVVMGRASLSIQIAQNSKNANLKSNTTGSVASDPVTEYAQQFGASDEFQM